MTTSDYKIGNEAGSMSINHVTFSSKRVYSLLTVFDYTIVLLGQ